MQTIKLSLLDALRFREWVENTQDGQSDDLEDYLEDYEESLLLKKWIKTIQDVKGNDWKDYLNKILTAGIWDTIPQPTNQKESSCKK